MNKKMIVIIVVVAVAVAVTIAFLASTFAAEESASTEVAGATDIAGEPELTEELAGEEMPAEEVVPAETLAPEPLSTPDSVARPNMSKEKVEYKDNKVEYTYHDVASDSQKTIEAEASTQSNLQFGLEVVAQQLFNVPLDQSPINPNSISLVDGNLYIDFSAKIYDANFGTSGEAGMLDNIANAYLENLPEVQAVYYSVDGANYSTGHFEIPGGVPYMSK